MKLLIVGATSAIAYETAKLFARDKANLFLVGRSASKIKAVRDDLLVRGANQVESFLLDLSILDRHQELIDKAIETLSGLDAVLIAHGTLGDQRAGEQSVAETMKQLSTNWASVISLVSVLANYFEQEKRGCLAVITSVAGDRGRKSNYIYGAAKGGVSLFLQGLRNRLYSAGVSVVDLKLGFVNTPMTAAIPKNTLFVQPSRVAQGIYRAMHKGKDVVYIPWFWRPIMLVIRHIPEVVFKRLNL